MFCFSQHRSIPSNSTFRVYKISRSQAGTTTFALVTIGSFVVAVRTSPCNIAVGKELIGLLVIVLLRRLFNEFSFIIELTEKFRCMLVMSCARSTTINIVCDTQTFKTIFNDCVITVYNILRSDTLLLSSNCNGNTMFITTANHQYLFTFQAEVACVNICWDIYSC